MLCAITSKMFQDLGLSSPALLSCEQRDLWIQAVPDPDHRPGADHEPVVIGLVGKSRSVRRYDQVVQGEQRAVRRKRLSLEHVQS